IRVDNPRGNSRVSIIFMRLPDGNVNGSGFRAANYESLARLEAGKVSVIHSVDEQSTYTSSQLTDSLLSLMRTYLPSEIRTQANFISRRFPDHSDHLAVGRYVKRARAQYDDKLPIKFYIGYPIYERPQNVTGEDALQTEAAFLAYSKFDEAVCHSHEQCRESKSSYGSYFLRQYQNNE
ncbi:hypothetical protein BVY00_02325, partial [bacterium G20]